MIVARKENVEDAIRKEAENTKEEVCTFFLSFVSKVR